MPKRLEFIFGSPTYNNILDIFVPIQGEPMERTPFRLLLVLCLFLSGFSVSRAGIVYSAAGDFSATTNTTSSTWQYGTFNSPSSTGFLINSNHGTTSGLNWWLNSPTVTSPNIVYNPTSSPISQFTYTIQSGQLGLHPGSLGEKAVIRFMAPTAGVYALNASFVGVNSPTTSSDATILKNGTSIFSSNISYGVVTSNSQTVNLLAGDTIDFAIGYGSNQTYYADMTGMTATLQAVPEPSTFLLVSLFVLVAVIVHYRRPRQVFAG